ncbi:hypothetical protein [Frateuria defendens]|uniref:hypothetical protein n=1 Tax=Frateuria defendens TaxID=2219559 RepID=UPI001F48A3EC|nr:hypothetical protein [Frateuria defendens]
MKVRIFALAPALLACCMAASAAESNSEYIKPDAPKGISDAFYACVDKAGSDTAAIANCLMSGRSRMPASTAPTRR